MWTRKAIKKNARATLKRTYAKTILVCLLILVFAHGYTDMYTPLALLEDSTSNSNIIDQVASDSTSKVNIEDTAQGLLEGFDDNIDLTVLNTDNYHPKNGYLAIVFNSITASNSVVIGLLNLLNNDALDGKASAFIIASFGTLILIAINIFFKQVLLVGEKRYFLESRRYGQTELNKLFMPYHIKKGYKSGLTMFVCEIYQFLWNLTIVGGLIKHYAYLMVPYILAENPTLNPNEAITLSRKMMDGQKKKAFYLTLSFLGWRVLNALTFGFLSIFFLNPYITATHSELYISLREECLVKNPETAQYFVDFYLTETFYPGNYVSETYPLPTHTSTKPDLSGYDRSYSLLHLVLMFFIFCFIGWTWEVSLHLASTGAFVNRGTLHGPWLPIYGCGGILMVLFVKRFSQSITKTFFACVVVAGVLEYSTATFLLDFKGLRWWDYSGYFLNIQGKICFEGLLVFGLGGIAMIYILAPGLDHFLNRFRIKPLKIIALILIFFFLIDLAYSRVHPNTGEGITTTASVSASNIPTEKALSNLPSPVIKTLFRS